MEAEVDRSDASALADLQMHWDEAYAIGLDGDIWSATFLGSADELRAHTSTELRELIRADYAYRQQARRIRAAAAGTEAATEAPADNDSSRSGPDGDFGSPDLADNDLDDDYAAHLDRAQNGGAQADDAQLLPGDVDSTEIVRSTAGSGTEADPGDGPLPDIEPDLPAGLSRAASPHGSYASLRGERMST